MKLQKGVLRDYVLIFVAGLAWDAIISVDTILTANFSWIGAAFTTVAVTLISYLMYDKIIDKKLMSVNWSRVVTLATGSGIGAAFMTWFLKGRV